VNYPRTLKIPSAHLSADMRDSKRGALCLLCIYLLTIHNSQCNDDVLIEYTYELSAMVLHHGVFATGGHYTAVCRDGYHQVVSMNTFINK
jgi:hypothetical protein